MMKIVKGAFLGAVALMFVANSVYAAEVTHYKSSGPGASAGFSSLDGCFYNDAYVASDDLMVFVSVSQYNWCTFTQLHSIYGSAPIGPNQFTGTKRLDDASLLADVVAYDYVTASEVSLSIDIDWEGEGDIFRGMSQSQSRSGAYFFSQKGSGSSRSAVPSGTISDGVTNYATGTYSWGQLSYTTNSSLSIVH